MSTSAERVPPPWKVPPPRVAPPIIAPSPEKRSEFERALLALKKNPEPLRAEIAKRSFYEFVKQMWSVIEPGEFKTNWHIELICNKLEAVVRGEIRRLIINVPPRSSKSTLISVMLPAWAWLEFPGKKFMTSSYAHSLSLRDSVKCRRIILSPLYQQRWKEQYSLLSDQNTKIRYENNKGGYRIATSVDGALTGEGGDIIVVDDPINSTDASSEIIRNSTIDWWDESMSTRLNDPVTGAYVIIMQRLHHQDLTGHLLEQGGWEHICLPMRYEVDHPYPCADDPRTEDGELLWPARFPEEEVVRLENTLGSYSSSGQLQQRPAPRSGGMFSREWWQYLDVEPDGGETVRAWDLAGSTDKRRAAWTAGIKMKRIGRKYYIIDVMRFRGTPNDVEKAIQNCATADGPQVVVDIPQDPGQAGKAQKSYLIGLLSGYNARSSLESGAKETRAEGLSAQTEAGNVYLIKGSWNKIFVDEAALFPNSDFKDQIDAASRAFHRLTRFRQRIGTGIGQLIVGDGHG